MVLSQTACKEEKVLNAIHFNIDPYLSEKNFFETIVFRLRWNRWNGNKTIQIIIEDV